MTVERLDDAQLRIAAVHKMLNRVQNSSGDVSVTEPKLEGIVDVLQLLVDELRELREEDADSGFASGGIEGPFDPNDRPWEK